MNGGYSLLQNRQQALGFGDFSEDTHKPRLEAAFSAFSDPPETFGKTRVSDLLGF
jgi:hypothetical protein